MSVPGMNLLSMALGAIGSQLVTYERYLGVTADGAGRQTPSYAAAVPVSQGSLQPVPRTRYEVLGLVMAKEYYTWFVPSLVLGVGRDCAGDRIRWNGKLLQLQTTTDWHGADGWTAVICVVLQNA